jgi:hypothetical protein
MSVTRGTPVYAVFGAMLIAIGTVVLMQKAGLLVWPRQVSILPLLFIGFGVAKLVETRHRRPRHGYIPLILGAWLLAGDLRWIELRETWPYLLIGFGVAIVVDVLWRPRPAARVGTGEPGDDTGKFAVIGFVIAASLMWNLGQFRTTEATSSSADRLHTFALMGRTRETSTAPAIHGGDITTIMGGSDVDLRQTSIAPGDEVTLEVTNVMGGTVLRVPDGWIIDFRMETVAGGIQDKRQEPPAVEGSASGPAAPRLVLRGLVLMGGLVIRS